MIGVAIHTIDNAVLVDVMTVDDMSMACREIIVHVHVRDRCQPVAVNGDHKPDDQKSTKHAPA